MDRISRCTPSLQKSYDPVRYRTVFASGSPIGVPFLQALATDPRYDVVWVLTMPDMPVGRGMKMQENVIAVESWKIPPTPLQKGGPSFVKKPHSLRLDSKKYADEAKATYEWLQSLDIDILYVVAYGHIIPQHILDLPKIAPINIHGSLLPTYRGASPLQQVFLDGLTQTGITLMRMEAWLDSGPMIDKQIIKLSFFDTVADLIDRVKTHTPKRSLDSIDQYVHGELEEEIQDESLVTHCGKISKENWELKIKNWVFDTLEIIYRKYKAYYLWPKIYMKLKMKNWELKIVQIDELVVDEELFIQYKDEWLFVDAQIPPTPLQKGGLSLNPAVISLQVKPEWKKTMSWDDFKRGYL